MHLRDAKTGLALATGLSLLAIAATPVPAAPGSTTVTFESQNGSGETGTAVLTAMGAKTKVVLTIAGAPKTAQPAHIHVGTCAKLNPAPKYPLTSVVHGKSTTVVPVSLAALLASPYAINVHKSMKEIPTYVACGDIKTAMTGAMVHGTMGGGSMGGGSTTGSPMGSGSMSGGMSSGGTSSHPMGENTPAPAANPSADASPQGPGSGGGSQVGPLPTPATSGAPTQGPESQASHAP